MKKIVISFLIALVLCIPLSITALAAEAPAITIDVDGKPLTMDVSPVEQNGRVLIPFRAIAESLGIEVSWDEKTNTVKAVKGNTVIILTIDSNVALVNGKEIILDVPATIKNNRTLVPIRFMAENIGSDVEWDGIKSKVIVKSVPAVTKPTVPATAPVTPVQTPVPPAVPTAPVVPVPADNSAQLNAIVSKYQSILSNIRDTSMAQLNDIIARATAQYMALPKDQQTQAKKVSIYASFLPEANTLETSTEAQVNSALDQMRAELESKGLATTSVEQARQQYNTQKQAKIIELYKKAGL